MSFVDDRAGEAEEEEERPEGESEGDEEEEAAGSGGSSESDSSEEEVRRPSLDARCKPVLRSSCARFKEPHANGNGVCFQQETHIRCS